MSAMRSLRDSWTKMEGALLDMGVCLSRTSCGLLPTGHILLIEQRIRAMSTKRHLGEVCFPVSAQASS
jgi:hypothetical protein